MIFVTVSTGHFDPLIRESDRLFLKNPVRFPMYGQIGSGFYLPSFPYLKMMPPEELDRMMGQAEIVISHGGTGMLSRLYRLRKKTVVIPKQVRYGEANDGQVELAEKWAELGMATLCMDVADLEAKIEECRSKDFTFSKFSKLGETLQKSLVDS
jgi:UDP-N-acetylglucosamine transferase subunit ALG13